MLGGAFVFVGSGFSRTYFRVAYGALHKATAAEGMGRLVEGLRKILTSSNP